MNDLKANLGGDKIKMKARTVKIPHRLSEAENDGIFWGASYVAQKCKNLQVSTYLATLKKILKLE